MLNCQGQIWLHSRSLTAGAASRCEADCGNMRPSSHLESSSSFCTDYGQNPSRLRSKLLNIRYDRRHQPGLRAGVASAVNTMNHDYMNRMQTPGPSRSSDGNGTMLGEETRRAPVPYTADERDEILEMRRKLNKKLSEANMYSRHLLRELNARDKVLNDAKLQLSSMQVELSALMEIAEEVAKEGGRPTTRKVNGRYIQSHLFLRLEGLLRSLTGQIEDVDLMRTREVPVVWYGMAEDVKIMGSFDAWTQGEQLSPESTGTFTKFSATLHLRPGRYEVKFLVDGEWRLAPQWPTSGDGGYDANNIFVVE